VILIPSAIAAILAATAFALKLKNEEMSGMSKELSELVIAIVGAAKDKHFTQDEVLKILREAEDVIEEAKKLLENGK